MEEAPENGKESSHSAHANGMTESLENTNDVLSGTHEAQESTYARKNYVYILIKFEVSVTNDTNDVDNIDPTSPKTHRLPVQRPTPLSCTRNLCIHTRTSGPTQTV
jgi:hypothetical protein